MGQLGAPAVALPGTSGFGKNLWHSKGFFHPVIQQLPALLQALRVSILHPSPSPRVHSLPGDTSSTGRSSTLRLQLRCSRCVPKSAGCSSTWASAGMGSTPVPALLSAGCCRTCTTLPPSVLVSVVAVWDSEPCAGFSMGFVLHDCHRVTWRWEKGLPVSLVYKWSL